MTLAKINSISKLTLCLVFACSLQFSCKEQVTKTAEISAPWDEIIEVKKQIVLPDFREQEYNLTDFGAVSGGVVNNTPAFEAAIAKCSADGGGKVIVPEGIYLSGPIHLLDNVNLHLNKGAEIRFSTDSEDYPLVHTSYEGNELMNFSPLVYAYRKTNIAITGEGVLNGQANHEDWWPWCGKETYGWSDGMAKQQDSLNLPRLAHYSENKTPVEERIFGQGYNLRPSFIEPFECKNVLIQGVKIINAPFWVIHPIKSESVTVDGVNIDTHGPNNDGCDPEYSKNVIIKNCVFNTGDDCIAIKSGRDEDGRRVAMKSENIIVEDCQMKDGHGGVVIGSEVSSGVSNVYVQNCTMDSPNLDRAIRIKTNSRRGGVIENVYVRNITVGKVKEALLRINMFYATYKNQTGDYIPTVQNIYLEDITVENSGKYGVLAKGYEESPIKNITLKNVTIEKADKAFSLENVIDVNFIDTYINGNSISYDD